MRKERALHLLVSAIVLALASPVRLEATCDQNLALHAPATASRWLDAGMAPDKATDGNPETAWNSGWNAPQWIEVDLGVDASVCGLRLIVNQTPAGRARHEIWGRTAAGQSTLLQVVDRDFTTGEELYVAIPVSAPAVRYVKVLTTSSPSWVSWYEVEVLATSPLPPIRVLTLDASRSGSCPGGTDWTFLTGNAFADVRAALQDEANFGPSGVVRRSIEFLPPVHDLTAENLEGTDELFLAISPTPAEVAAVGAFVEQGGGLFVFHNSAASAFGAAFGAVAGGAGSGCASVSDPNSPMTAGPFGVVTGCIAPEYHNRFQDVGATGSTFLSDGAPVGASFTHGLGRAVLICDEEWCMTTRESGCAIGSGTTTTTRLFLNAVAHLTPTQTSLGCLTVSTELAGFAARSTTSQEATFDGLPEGEIASPVSEGAVSVSGPGLYIARPGGPADECCFSPHLTSPLLTANGAETLDITFPAMSPTAVGFEATTNRFPPGTVRVFDVADGEVGSFAAPLPPNARGFIGITACQPIGRVRWEGVGGESEDTGIDEIRVGFVNAPAAPSNLIATLLCPPRAELAWQDNSDDETGFEIQQEDNGSAIWTTVALVPADVETWTSGPLTGGSHAFRARSCDGAACSVWSPARSVEVSAPAVLNPNGDVFWLTGQDTVVTVSWTPPEGCVDHLDLAVSVDGQETWTALASDVDAALGTWSGAVSVSRADTVGAHVRLTAYASDEFVGSSISEPFAVGYKGSIRLDVQRWNSSVFSPPILFWPAVEGVLGYAVTVESDPLTSCRQDSWGVDVPATRNWVRFDATKWTGFPATRCRVRVQAIPAEGDPTPPTEAMNFVRFKLADLDPYDTEGKPPVILVHGWTSDQSTWYACDESPLIDALINGPPGQRFHPWAYEYPNIQAVVHSAAGLDSAAHFVSNGAGGASIRIIAHSMGGLVARAYVQGLAVDPSFDPDAEYQPRPPVVSISHVVTLSTPHLGEPSEAVVIAAHRHATGELLGVPGRYLTPTCPGCEQSASALNLRDDSPLLLRLNSMPLPPLAYLFTGGIDHVGEFPGAYRSHRLEELSGCNLGADATVDVCSARAGCGEETDDRQRPTFESGATVVRSHYNLSHGRMSGPGFTFDPRDCQKAYDEVHRSESAYLLNDVLGFVRCDDCVPTSSCPNPARKEFRQRLVTKGAPSSAASRRESRAPVSGATVPVIGATVRLFQLDSPDSLAGMVGFSDSAGDASVTLPPGMYGLEFRAPGMIGRVDTVEVPATTTQIVRTTALDGDDSFTGPRDPVLVINNGALVTTSPLVIVNGACMGATEVLLSERPDFAGATWQALAGPMEFALTPDPGMKAIYAQFRDDQLQESEPISALIRLSNTSPGRVDVTLSGTTGEVVIDGFATGQYTPVAGIPLAEGIHHVSIHASGWVISPPVASVAVVAGCAVQASFMAGAAPTPGDAFWVFPEDGAVIGSASRLRWASVSLPALGEVLFYNCLFSRDSTFSSTDLFRLGLSDTCLQVSPGLSDSTTYFASIQAVNGFGVPQAGPSETIRLGMDRTPPDVAIVFPTAGSILQANSSYEVGLTGQDWGGLSQLILLLSRDGGGTFADTIYAGAYRDTITWVPNGIGSDRCRLEAEVLDQAGNPGTALSDSLFSIEPAVATVEHAGLGDGPWLRVWPSPTRDRAQVTFFLPATSTAKLDCFDIQGRRIATLAAGSFPAGSHTVDWKLSKSGEVGLAAGVYFVRVQLPHRTLVERILLIH